MASAATVLKQEGINYSSEIEAASLAKEDIDGQEASLRLPPIEEKKKEVSKMVDFLPQELIATLKRRTATHEESRKSKSSLSPREQFKTSVLRPPANAWNYNKQRQKLKHLTEHSPCICGAGRDISFLYDAVKAPAPGSDTRPQDIPESLIPSEFHIVKHPGVHGVEYREDQYCIKPEEHPKHMTTFPSLNPAGRQEAIALKQTLHLMLEKAGVLETSSDPLTCPTQLHGLVELINKEQNIYNIIFHEVIRQVSVNCSERGAVLSELREKYSGLFNKVPTLIMSLHEELLAQRALDRRLTSELMEFKDDISKLAMQLEDVKEREEISSANMAEDKNLLHKALESSERSSSILEEYHSLYELQRKRLEDRIAELKGEKNIWQNSSYQLAHKLADRQNLQDVRRLQVSERSWYNLAEHFTIILSDKDMQQLLVVQEHILSWKETVSKFAESQDKSETLMIKDVKKVIDRMTHWNKEFSEILHFGSSPSKGKKEISSEDLKDIAEDISQWLKIVGNYSALFSGDSLMNQQEKIRILEMELEAWTDEAVSIFSRHRTACSKKEDGSPSKSVSKEEELAEHSQMIQLNNRVNMFLKAFQNRLIGENGTASALVNVANGLESWSERMCLSLENPAHRLSSSEWERFFRHLLEWSSRLNEVIEIGTSTEKSNCLQELLVDANKWINSLINVINSKDAQLTEEVEKMHLLLTQWMVDLMLHMTKSPEDEEFVQFLGNVELPTHTSLRSRSNFLMDKMTDFTQNLVKCCEDIVHTGAAQQRQQEGQGMDVEMRDLKRMELESKEWTKGVQLLLKEVLEDAILQPPATPLKETEGLSKREESQQDTRASMMDAVESECEVVFVIGEDSNVHKKSLFDVCNSSTAVEESEGNNTPLSRSGEFPTDDDIPALPENSLPKPEDLILELDQVEQKLKEKETAYEQLEMKTALAERHLQSAQQQISSLQAETQRLQTLLEESTKMQTLQKPKKRTNKRN